MQLRRGAALVQGDDVARLAPAHGVHVALAAVDHEVPAGHEQRGETADALDEDVAPLVDVRDDEADLVGVRGHGDERAVLGPDAQPHVAEGVALSLAQRREAAADDVLHRRLEPRRARRLTQSPQQLEVSCHHPSLVRWRQLVEGGS